MKTKSKRSTKAALDRRSNRLGRPPSKAISSNATIELVPLLLGIKSILVPIDFSPASEKALTYAIPLARQFGAKLTLLHVVEPVATPDFLNSFPLVMDNDQVKAKCKSHLDQVATDLGLGPEVLEKTLVRFGRSFHEISDAARSLKADLIVISTHGHVGLKHAVLGSTTERVVRHAPCPVLVVRPREREFV